MNESTQAASDSMVGQVLDGRYELVEFIAKGGMGQVYKATQWPLDRVVAVKLLLDVSGGMEEFRKRFFLEASLCARLSHPNIIRIFDYGCHGDSTYYIAMEYLRGQTLKELLAQTGPMHPRRVLALMIQVCSALVEAHDADLVHRDLKPSNLMVFKDALGKDVIKILDFGVVKQMSVDMEFTQVGGTLGSPLFMSPEQIEDKDLDGRSDLYSLGVIMFRLLTGRLPFMAASPVQVVVKHLTEPIPAFSDVNPSIEVGPGLESLVRRAMSKDRQDRFENARVMLLALSQCLEGPSGPSDDVWSDEPNDGWGLDEEDSNALHDMPTQTLPELGSMDDPEPLVSSPPFEDVSFDTSFIERMGAMSLHGYVAYVDLNCPYCFALHERMTLWGIASKIEWCMVEHASHVLDGPFDLHQEALLTTEVFEVHHRAPDVRLELPPQRCRSTMATRLVVYVQRQYPEKVLVFRRAAYVALWQEGRDIGDEAELRLLLNEQGLPLELLDLCVENPPELEAWQEEWGSGEYDHSIPVLAHPATERVLIGLPTQRSLEEFLLQQRSRVVDGSVCYYQRRPAILVCGRMSHLWQLLSDVRSCCEVIQATTAKKAAAQLQELAVPELVVAEFEHFDLDSLKGLAKLARERSVPLVVASLQPTAESEIEVLSMGAVEYLPLTGDGTIGRIRLDRVLRSRYNLERVHQKTHTDELTGLPTRRSMLERLEEEWDRAKRSGGSLAVVLLDINRFKLFNRTHGYISGDRVLVNIATELQEQMGRSGNFLTRYGGNEYAVIMPDTDTVAAETMAEQLKQSIRQLGIESREDESGYLSLRSGIASIKVSSTGAAHMLLDAALRESRAARLVD